eukprot:1591106-Pyramimonas_sp.AAC.1
MTPEQLDQRKKEVTTKEAELRKTRCIQDFKDALGISVKRVKDYKKKLNKQGSADGPKGEVANDPQCAKSLSQVVEILGDQFQHAVSNAPTDIWKNKVVLLNRATVKTMTDDMMKSEPFKKQFQWIEKRMKKDKSNALACPVAKGPMATNISKLKKEELPESFITCLPLAGAAKEWARRCATTSCAPPSRGSLEGTPGHNIPEKVSFLEKGSPDDLQRLRTSHGFACVMMRPGDVLAIPANHFELTHVPLGVGGDHGGDFYFLRWGASPETINDPNYTAVWDKIKSGVKNMLESYPSLAKDNP